MHSIPGFFRYRVFFCLGSYLTDDIADLLRFIVRITSGRLRSQPLDFPEELPDKFHEPGKGGFFNRRLDKFVHKFNSCKASLNS